MLPTMPHLEATIREGIANWPVNPQIVIGEIERRAAFRIAHAALAKSGWGALNVDGVMKTIAFIIISPVLGFVLGSCFMLGIAWIFFRVPPSSVNVGRNFPRRGCGQILGLPGGSSCSHTKIAFERSDFT